MGVRRQLQTPESTLIHRLDRGRLLVVRPVKRKGEALHGSLEFWADNRVKGQLVSTVGVFATVNFESMGEWSAAAGGKVTIAWEEPVDDTDYNVMSYDEGAKLVSWSGLDFVHQAMFESHMASSPGRRAQGGGRP